jgi:hypothetical protein
MAIFRAFTMCIIERNNELRIEISVRTRLCAKVSVWQGSFAVSGAESLSREFLRGILSLYERENYPYRPLSKIYLLIRRPAIG